MQLGKQFREHLETNGLLAENYCEELTLLRFLKVSVCEEVSMSYTERDVTFCLS